MRLLSRLWVFALLVFFIVGCTQVTEGPVQLVCRVVDEFSREPLDGVVCHVETDNCLPTDSVGMVVLEVPANEKISLTLESNGYGSVLQGGLSRDGDPFLGPASTGLWPDAFLVDQSDRLGIIYPLQMGMINVFISPSLAGATFDLVDATGRGFYADEDGNWDLGLTETTTFDERGGFTEAGFVNVPSGEFQIEIGGTAQRCTPFAAWPGNAVDKFLVPVQEGFITYLTMTCPPP